MKLTALSILWLTSASVVCGSPTVPSTDAGTIKEHATKDDSHDSSISSALTGALTGGSTSGLAGGLTLLKQFSSVESEIKKVPETGTLTAATLEVLMEELVKLQTVINSSKDKSNPPTSSDAETGSSTAQLDGQWQKVLQNLQNLTQTAKKNPQVLEKDFKGIEAALLAMIGQLQHHFGNQKSQTDSS